MNFAQKHAGVLASVIKAANASVTFTLDSPGREQRDGTMGPPSQDVVVGYAIEEDGDPEEYIKLSLSSVEAPRLFFVANTYGDIPALNSRCSWGGQKYTVKSVKPFRPNGTALFTYVIIAR